MNSCRFLLSVMISAFLLASPLCAQHPSESKKLSNEQILEISSLGLEKPLPRFRGWTDGSHFLIVRNSERGTKTYIRNIRTGKEEEYSLPVRTSVSEESVLDRFMKLPFVHDVKNPTASPDNLKVAYTDKDHNLCVWNSVSGNVRKLTGDGNRILMNGYASWVYYEEILGRPSRYKAFWWNPDSRTIAFYKFNDSLVRMFPIYHPEGKYGFLNETRYPKAGDLNPEVEIAFVDTESGHTVWADFKKEEDQYFGQPFWNNDGSRLIIPWMPRRQNRLILYTVDPADGSKEPIYKEEQTTWIDWMKDMQFTEDGFFMVRDFDMWEQIYFQSFDGKRLERITEGKNWSIKFVKVDMKSGYIYFTARREVSTRNDFYKVCLKTGKITRLSVGNYDYQSVVLSPDNRHFIATCSNSNTPTRLVAISDDRNHTLQILGDSRGEHFDDYKLAVPEMLSITTSDGYVLPAQVFWPVDLDSTRKYPVLVSIYGGPDAGTVMDKWKGISEKTQWWPNNGVITISMDHRASGHCGKEGLNFMFRNLLTVELDDYILWMKYLNKKPFVDPDKVGITGFSYGGSMTVLACTKGNEYFKYGIAGGGVYDYMLYDSHYTERYMDRPQDNPEGYDQTVLSKYVENYKGDKTNYLRITHGTSDDNVHMQNTMHLISVMQDAGKQFDLMLYPGEFHGYRGNKGKHSVVANMIFWYRYLLEKDVPQIWIDSKLSH